jgi:hypothetical protein
MKEQSYWIAQSFESEVVTRSITFFAIKSTEFCSHSVFVFHMIPTTHSEYFPEQH